MHLYINEVCVFNVDKYVEYCILEESWDLNNHFALPPSPSINVETP